MQVLRKVSIRSSASRIAWKLLRKKRAEQHCVAAQLPTEIILAIVELIRETWPPHIAANSRDKLGWIVISHVCWRWRDIILGRVSFWTELVDVPSSWAPEYMRRSQNADLSVYIFQSRADRKFHRRVRQILDNIHRVESLNLTNINVHDLSSRSFHLPAPHLSSLILDGHVRRQRGILSPNIFAGQFPRLQNLALANVTVDLNNPLLSTTLTTLVLNRCHFPQPLLLADFLNILRPLHKLKKLAVCHILAAPPDPEIFAASLHHVPVVPLLQLENLQIHTIFFLNYHELVKKVQLNWQSICIDLVIFASLQEIRDQVLLPGYVTPLDRQSPPLRAIELKDTTSNQFLLSGWRTADGKLDSSNVAFRADVSLKDAEVIHGMTHLSMQLPLHLVQKLTIALMEAGDHKVPFWCSLMQHMVSVQWIVVYQNHSYVSILSPLEALAITGADLGSDNAHVPPCPSLSRLHFPSQPYDPSGASALFFVTLAHTLRSRDEYSLPPVELMVGNEVIPYLDLDDLEAVLQEHASRAPEGWKWQDRPSWTSFTPSGVPIRIA